MSRLRRFPNGPLIAVLAAAVAAACSEGEHGVIQAQAGDPAISLSEGACPATCPVYDMTLHPNGAYLLNGERFVRRAGVSDGNIGKDAWTEAEKMLKEASFWTLKPVQTRDTMDGCQRDAPTAKVTWRTAEGKEKTVTYNAGCGVEKMQVLIRSLRVALKFDDLVWTDAKFDPNGNR